MNRDRRHLSVSQPLTYRVSVQGRVDERWMAWFEGMDLTVELGESAIPTTVLEGTLADQAALHGLLRKLYSLGFVILSLTCKDVENKEAQ